MKESTKTVYKKLDRLQGMIEGKYYNAIYNGQVKDWNDFKKKYILEIADIFAIAKTQAALNRIIETNVDILKCDEDIKRYWNL